MEIAVGGQHALSILVAGMLILTGTDIESSMHTIETVSWT
jgi:hypothetical protein